MTLEEIAALRAKIPDPPPNPYQIGGKSPDQLSVDDIMNGPQIGIVKPGESIPGVTLAPEADKMLDDLFAPKADEPKADEPKAKKPRKPRAKKTPDTEGK